MTEKVKESKSLPQLDGTQSAVLYLLTLAGLIVAQLIASIIMTATGYQNSLARAVYMLLFQAAMAAVLIAFLRTQKRALNFRYFKRENSKFSVGLIVAPVIVAVCVMAGMYLPTIGVSAFVQYVTGYDASSSQLTFDSALTVVMLVFATVVAAPIVEETIYRGVVFHGAIDRLGAVKSAVLCSFAFMLMHMGPLQTVYQFALSMACCFIAYQSGRVALAIAVHAISNVLALIQMIPSVQVALNGIFAWCGANPWLAFVIALVMFVGAFAICFTTVRRLFYKELQKSQGIENPVFTWLPKRCGAAKNNSETSDAAFAQEASATNANVNASDNANAKTSDNANATDANATNANVNASDNANVTSSKTSENARATNANVNASDYASATNANVNASDNARATDSNASDNARATNASVNASDNANATNANVNASVTDANAKTSDNASVTSSKTSENASATDSKTSDNARATKKPRKKSLYEDGMFRMYLLGFAICLFVFIANWIVGCI